MDAGTWNERYRSAELVWGVGPNRWVEQQLADVTPGWALDLACGEGRNALWLAALGWHVTAVDFSEVALEKGRLLEQSAQLTVPIEWVCADATRYRCTRLIELAVICYLQVPAEARRSSVRAAAESLAPGGILFVVGHHSRNIADGTGGPQDPSVLFTAEDLVSDLDGTGLIVDNAMSVLRPVEGAARPAIDALLRAHAPRQNMSA